MSEAENDGDVANDEDLGDTRGQLPLIEEIIGPNRNRRILVAVIGKLRDGYQLHTKDDKFKPAEDFFYIIDAILQQGERAHERYEHILVVMMMYIIVIDDVALTFFKEDIKSTLHDDEINMKGTLECLIELAASFSKIAEESVVDIIAKNIDPDRIYSIPQTIVSMFEAVKMSWDISKLSKGIRFKQ